MSRPAPGQDVDHAHVGDGEDKSEQDRHGDDGCHQGDRHLNQLAPETGSVHLRRILDLGWDGEQSGLRNLGLIDTNVYWMGRPVLAMGSVIAVHTWRVVPLAAVIRWIQSIGLKIESNVRW